MSGVRARATQSALNGVVVLGMGRSGTSAVAAMFVAAGFFVAASADRMPPNEANPRGHFENLRLYRVNDRVLEALGGDWLVAPSEERQRNASVWAIPTLRAELERIRRDAAGCPLVVKDPRIGVMLPLWGPLLGESFLPVFVIRHPWEVALSLRRRDAIGADAALAGWEDHTRSILSYLQGREALVVHYERLVAEPQLAVQTVRAATARLDGAVAAGIDPGRAAAAIDPALHRNRTGAAEPGVEMTAAQLGLWRWLTMLPGGINELGAPPAEPASTPAPEPTGLAVVNDAGEGIS